MNAHRPLGRVGRTSLGRGGWRGRGGRVFVNSWGPAWGPGWGPGNLIVTPPVDDAKVKAAEAKADAAKAEAAKAAKTSRWLLIGLIAAGAFALGRAR